MKLWSDLQEESCELILLMYTVLLFICVIPYLTTRGPRGRDNRTERELCVRRVRDLGTSLTLVACDPLA